MTKEEKPNYGHLPPKEVVLILWQKLYVDLIGRHRFSVKFKNKKAKKTETLWCVTMIDPTTLWFQMKQMKYKTTFIVASIVKKLVLQIPKAPENHL